MNVNGAFLKSLSIVTLDQNNKSRKLYKQSQRTSNESLSGFAYGGRKKSPKTVRFMVRLWCKIAKRRM